MRLAGKYGLERRRLLKKKASSVTFLLRANVPAPPIGKPTVWANYARARSFGRIRSLEDDSTGDCVAVVQPYTVVISTKRKRVEKSLGM
jgi:hypothetical protein